MSAAPGPEAVTSYPPAGLDRRFYAFALDRLLTWLALALAAYAAFRLSWDDGGLWPGLLLLLGSVALLVAGSAALTALRGASPGKSALDLRVVDVASGSPIGFGPAVLRCVVLGLAGLPTFGLGLATLAQTAVLDPDRRRRGWHDRAAGSIVVDVRPVTEQAPVADEAPRQVVNLTAMRLAPATVRPPVSPPRRAPSESTRPAGAGTGEVPTGVRSAQPAAAPPAGSLPQPPVPAEPAPTHRPGAGPDPGPDPDPDKTVVRGAHRGPSTPSVRWRVSFDSGETVLVDGPVLVGRRPEGRAAEEVRRLVPLRSQDMSLSKTHAQLHVAPDGALVVTDRGSTNGSALIRSGVWRALPPGRPTTLLSGDTVVFGDRSMSVARET